jgi:predicted site-specific integrase-resolvase
MQPQSNDTTNPQRDSEPWVNTAGACKHLHISIPTMRRWIKEKRVIPKRTPTGEYRFRLSELDALLQ